MSIPASESNRSPKDLAYGNWIRKRVLWSLGLAVLAALALAAAPVYPALRLSGALLAVALLVSLSFPLYAYYAFSPAGGNLQDRVYQLLIDSLRPWPIGPALDIGAGNGVLAIKLSIANPDSRVTGIDYWGTDWEYAQSVCEDNARRARVDDRVAFVRGTAAGLPFGENEFAVVTSNLTFHEVKSELNKRHLIEEALRVLRPGGRFAFVDLFYDDRHYGATSDLESFLGSLGLSRVDLTRLDSHIALPAPLRLRRALGQAGLVCGQK